MMTEMKLPACYAVIDENEMTYLDGGATIADSDAYKAFLNVGQVFELHPICYTVYLFLGCSSIDSSGGRSAKKSRPEIELHPIC